MPAARFGGSARYPRALYLVTYCPISHRPARDVNPRDLPDLGGRGVT